MISQKSIEEVLDVAKVEDIIDEFVTLKKRGVNLIGLCPFHNEKTPSFTVSPTKNLYKCFGCGKGGSAVSFIMEHENYSFPEAVRFLAKRYNIELEEDKSRDENLESKQEKESLFIINEFAKDFFHQQLLNTDEGKSVGLSYFKQRGLLLSTITDFKLGYSPTDPKALISRAEKKGYKSEFLEKLGLKSRSRMDFFRSRIIFPITNLSGKTIAFGGRTLSSDKKIPKYLNSQESDIYNKSKSLYGIFQAKTEMRRNDNCYLVEGYTDVLSLHQNKIKNVVASSGTALTPDQLRVIKRFSSTVTFLYDGDEAGQKAAVRGMSLALDQELDVKIVPLLGDQDPDSILQEVGADAFQKILEDNAKDFIVYRARSIDKKYKDLPIEKSQAVKALIADLAHIKDGMKRSIYVKEVSVILQIDEQSILNELNKNIRKILNNRKRDYHQPSMNPSAEEVFVSEKKKKSEQGFRSSDYYQEKEIIRVLLQFGDKTFNEEGYTVADFIIENLHDVLDSFRDEHFKSIIEEYIANNNRWSIDHFINHPEEKIKEIALEFAEPPYEYANWSEFGVELQTQKMLDENFEKDSLQVILRFKLRKLSLKVDEIQKRIKSGTATEEEREILLMAYKKVMQHRKELAEKLGAIVL